MCKNMEVTRCYSGSVTASCETLTDSNTGIMNKNNSKATLKEDMAALQNYDPEELRQRYLELIGVDAGAFGARFLQRRCAHRLQENALGGLTEAELETLSYISEHDPQVNKNLRSSPRSSNDTRGVVFRKVYHGKVYEMRALGNGRYEYDGKIYTSPTAVVRAITGKNHYNGVAWWGLKKQSDAK